MIFWERWHLLEGLAGQIMELPVSLLSHVNSTDFTLAHSLLAYTSIGMLPIHPRSTRVSGVLRTRPEVYNVRTLSVLKVGRVPMDRFQ